MSDDPLARWRRPGPQNAPSGADASGESNVVDLANYQGDTGKDRSGGWLEFRPMDGPWALCSYAQLRKISFNGAKPTRIDLIFTYEMVTVRGKNLETLLTGLRFRTLGCIEQFDPATKIMPDPDALIVESIVSTDNGPPLRPAKEG